MATKEAKAKELLAGGITQEQLDAWKRDNPEGVHTLVLTTKKAVIDPESKKEISPAETATIYLKDPYNKPAVIGEAYGKDTQEETYAYILAALFLGGDKDAVYKTAKTRFWAGLKAFGLIDADQVELKKV